MVWSVSRFLRNQFFAQGTVSDSNYISSSIKFFFLFPRLVHWTCWLDGKVKMLRFPCSYPGFAFFAMTKHRLETPCNVAHIRQVCPSLQTDNFPSFTNVSRHDISCRTHRSRAKKPWGDRYLETNFIGPLTQAIQMQSGFLKRKFLLVMYLGKKSQNERECNESSASLLTELVGMNKDIG